MNKLIEQSEHSEQSEVDIIDNRDNIIKDKNNIIKDLQNELNQLRKFVIEKETHETKKINLTTFDQESPDNKDQDNKDQDNTEKTDTYINISDIDSDINSDIKPNKPNKSKEIINNWDNEANNTLKNWYYAFKEISHIYQFTLDRNYKISEKLHIASIVSSSTLSIFAGIKLWLPDDINFQTSTNVIMLISNLVIAGITTMSKRYIDDNRNEKIKIYIEEVDKFMNLIYAEYCLSPCYRTNAKDFFKSKNDQYTKLMISSPNLSIKEMEEAKKNYILYRKTYHNHDRKNLENKDNKDIYV